MLDLTKSQALLAQAREVIPAGVTSNVRLRERPFPLFFVRGLGSRLWDADGNQYLDYVLANGPMILGHSPQPILDRVNQAVSELQLCAAQTALEIEVARRGRTSTYRGPILLTYDRRYNEMDQDDLPVLDAQQLKAKKVRWKSWIPPQLLLEFGAADGRKVRLCDFGSAGEGGTPYRSWLRVKQGTSRLKEYFAPSKPANAEEAANESS